MRRSFFEKPRGNVRFFAEIVNARVQIFNDDQPETFRRERAEPYSVLKFFQQSSNDFDNFIERIIFCVENFLIDMSNAQRHQQPKIARRASFNDFKIIFAAAVNSARYAVKPHAVAKNYLAVFKRNVIKLNRTLHIVQVAENLHDEFRRNFVEPIAQHSAK